CDIPLAAGMLGCGDCQDGMLAIHPNAVEVCNNLDDDCNIACDTTSHQCAASTTADGSGECGKPGPSSGLPDCCSNQSACRDLKNDFNSCGQCTVGHVTNCNPLFANLCVNSGCSCGATMMAPCGTKNWCNGGTCTNCG